MIDLKAVVYISICFLVLEGKGQDNSIAQYLLSAEKDKQLERYQAELNFLESTSMRPSLIRETEVRMTTERLETKIDDYRLRVSPTNPWEIRANNRYKTQLEENTKTRYQISFSKALKTRYEMLLKHSYLSEMIRHSREEVDFRKKIADQITLQQTTIDLEELIEIESDLSNEEIKLAEMEMELNEAQEMIALDIENQIDWTGFNMITPESVSSYLEIQDSTDQQNLYKLNAQQNFALEEKMFQVNKTEAFSNIGFLQANYETDRDGGIDNKMGLQLGITIPIANRDKADLARDRFELIEAKTDKEEKEQMVDQRIEILKSKLQSSYKMYAMINAKIERLEKLKPTVSEAADLKPFISYTTYRISLSKKKTDLHIDIVEDFIDLLDLQGLLVKSPLTNYLSNELSIIE